MNAAPFREEGAEMKGLITPLVSLWSDRNCILQGSQRGLEVKAGAWDNPKHRFSKLIVSGNVNLDYLYRCDHICSLSLPL